MTADQFICFLVGFGLGGGLIMVLAAFVIDRLGQQLAAARKQRGAAERIANAEIAAAAIRCYCKIPSERWPMQSAFGQLWRAIQARYPGRKGHNSIRAQAEAEK